MVHHTIMVPGLSVYCISSIIRIIELLIREHFVLGMDMDVCLTKYGHCNYASAKHAAIFYDEVSTFNYAHY